MAQLGRSIGGPVPDAALPARREPDEIASTGPRVGYAVPRRVGDAVDRNAVKRRLKAAVDRHEELLEPGTDYVVIARPGLAAALEAQDFDWLCDQVTELLTRSVKA